jgi:hypothetical protein
MERNQWRLDYKAFIIGLNLCFLIVTNKWLSWDDGIIKLSANDAYAYAKIAELSPSLLNLEALSFHHTQRFIVPYLLGIISKFTTIPYQYLFAIVVFLCCTLVIICADRIFTKLQLRSFSYKLCMSLLILNPYVFRYYWIVPAILPDTIFTTGLAISLKGLVDKKFLIVVVGVLIAAIGRQTALVLIPGIIFWLFFAKGWSELSLIRKLSYSVILISIIFGIYLFTGKIASTFASPSENEKMILGFFTWLQSDRFTISNLAEFLMRLFIPFTLLTGTITGFYVAISTSKRKGQSSILPTEFWACILINICISLQPFLGGPDITGQNASRLTTLGFFPLLVALAFLMNNALSFDGQAESQPQLIRMPFWEITIAFSLFLASFHHLYTIFGPPNSLIFSVIQVFCGVVIGYSVFRIFRTKVLNQNIS